MHCAIATFYEEFKRSGEINDLILTRASFQFRKSVLTICNYELLPFPFKTRYLSFC
jgi:hypothetical protein